MNIKIRERVIISQGWKREETVLVFLSHNMQICVIIHPQLHVLFL